MKLLRRYSFLQLLSLAYLKIRTILTFKNARIIRFPIDIRGKKFIQVSKGFTTGVGCRIEAYPIHNQTSLFFGENFQMNDYVHITAMEKVLIGNNVLMASKIYISDCAHGIYSGSINNCSPEVPPVKRPFTTKPVVIEDNVWIGEFVSILPGVTVGKGTIIGANSVVTKSLPPNIIAVGIPAKAIKKYNFETQKWERI